ncbi:MAG TPA: hypothetical protein VE821_00685 [Pyrinomonadaceae bacterium]|nr:hypothetical protein [Pyrinomonadaceae bacterium]
MNKESKQREKMKELARRFGANKERVIREYAEAEKRGEVKRESNTHNWTAEQYARALWRDAMRRDWLDKS